MTSIKPNGSSKLIISVLFSFLDHFVFLIPYLFKMEEAARATLSENARF